MVANFKAGAVRDVPITAGHDGMQETPAVGWFVDLIDRGVNGLYGLVEWNDEGQRLLSGKMFKYFSAEIDFDRFDLETEEEYGPVLTGGALTNHPFFKQLDLDPSEGFDDGAKKAPVMMFNVPSIMKQFNFDTMDLKEILAKKPEDLSADEQAFVREHKDELDADQQSAFASVLEETDTETEEEKTAREEKEKGDANEAAGLNRDGSAKVAASDKTKNVTLSAAEYAVLKSQADKGATAFEEVEKMKLDKEVSALVFSESNKEGRILPKQTKAVADFMFSLSAKQRDQFRNIVNNLPKATFSLGEIGDGGNAGATVFAEVEAKVKEVRKADETLTYSDALRKVFAENPELADRYNAGDETEEQ